MPQLNCAVHSAINCVVTMKDPTFNASPSLESTGKWATITFVIPCYVAKFQYYFESCSTTQ